MPLSSVDKLKNKKQTHKRKLERIHEKVIKINFEKQNSQVKTEKNNLDRWFIEEVILDIIPITLNYVELIICIKIKFFKVYQTAMLKQRKLIKNRYL